MNPTSECIDSFIHKTAHFLNSKIKTIHRTGLLVIATEYIESGIITAGDIFIIENIINNNISEKIKNKINNKLFIYNSNRGAVNISVYSFIKFNLTHEESIRVVMPRTKYTECSIYNLKIYVYKNGQKFLLHITVNGTKEQIYSAGYIERVNDGFDADELNDYSSLKSIIIQEPFYEFLSMFYSDSITTGLLCKKNKLMKLLHNDNTSYMEIINQIWMDSEIQTIEKPFLRYQTQNNSIIDITLKSLVNDISNDHIITGIDNNINKDLIKIITSYLIQ
jgi:hypothetical protein